MEEVKKEKMHQKMQLLYILTRELVLCKLFTGQNNLFQHFSNIFFRHKWVMKRTIVVYFDQLLGAARTRKLVELHFFSCFQAFLFFFCSFSDVFC